MQWGGINISNRAKNICTPCMQSRGYSLGIRKSDNSCISFSFDYTISLKKDRLTPHLIIIFFISKVKFY